MKLDKKGLVKSLPDATQVDYILNTFVDKFSLSGRLFGATIFVFEV
jgi:hypothetical protein